MDEDTKEMIGGATGIIGGGLLGTKLMLMLSTPLLVIPVIGPLLMSISAFIIMSVSVVVGCFAGSSDPASGVLSCVRNLTGLPIPPTGGDGGGIA